MRMGPNQHRPLINEAVLARNAAIRAGEWAAKTFVYAWFESCLSLAESCRDTPTTYDTVVCDPNGGYVMDEADAHAIRLLLGKSTFSELLDELRFLLTQDGSRFPFEVQIYRMEADGHSVRAPAFALRSAKHVS